MKSNWSSSWMWYPQWTTIFYFNQAVPMVCHHTSEVVWHYLRQKKTSTSEFKIHATKQAMYVQHFTLARLNVHILDFCHMVIPFHPDGVTLSVGVQKCTYLSRNVNAVIRVLYLFEELRFYVWLRLSHTTSKLQPVEILRNLLFEKIYVHNLQAHPYSKYTPNFIRLHRTNTHGV
jgi:hypothetical protein